MAKKRKKCGDGWVLGGSQVLNSLGKSVGDGVRGASLSRTAVHRNGKDDGGCLHPWKIKT